MEENKPIWKSKTFWMGVLTVCIGVLEALQGELQTGVGLTTLGFVNIALRAVTDTKVAWK